jgi:hypothetical protein
MPQTDLGECLTEDLTLYLPALCPIVILRRTKSNLHECLT